MVRKSSKAQTPRLDGRPKVGRLLDAAAVLFAKKGYARTSIEDIAEAVGVLKGSLYYYIDTKEDLLFRLLDDTRVETVAIAEEVAAMTGLPPLEKLRTYVVHHVEYAARNVLRMKVYYHDFEHLSVERQKIVGAQNAFLNDFVQNLVEDAQREGSIDHDLDSRLLAFSVFGTINYVHTWYRNDGRVKPAELARLFAELVLNGLAHADAGQAARGLAATDGGRRR